MDQVEDLIRNNDMITFRELVERAADRSIPENSVTGALKGLVDTGRAEVRRNGHGFGRWTVAVGLILLFFVGGCGPRPNTIPPTPITKGPAPELGWPLRYVTNPPLPMARSSERASSKTVTSAIVPSLPSAEVALMWDKPASGVDGINIYSMDGVKLLTVNPAYNNCTIRRLFNGATNTYYATATWLGDESGPSNLALGVARVFAETKPSRRDWVFAYTWKGVNGVTNALQWKGSLSTNWQTLVRFRGTNGTAVVSRTNQPGFYRVSFENTTNQNTILTQTVTHVLLTWSNRSGSLRLEREMDKNTGSFVTVLTNSQIGTISSIQPAGHQYRLMKHGQ